MELPAARSADPTREEPTTRKRDAARRPSKRPSAPRYRTGEVVGRGGMGEVVAVEDLRLGRQIAVKRMRAKQPGERAVHRFLREARIQARLDHPAIVPVHDVGHDRDGRPYFTMKKISGTTLADILRRPSYSRQQLLRAFVDVCLALELAHTRGVIHRDIKPDNLVLGEFREVYVLDWGVAKVIGEAEDFVDVTSTRSIATAEGALVGTPGYMAPEQIRGEPDLGPAADVYSLGCVLHEILVGRPLHPSGNAGIESTLLELDTRPSSRAGDVPPELDDLCALATGPRELRPTARELGERVQRFLDGDRDLMQRRRLAREHLARALAAFAGGGDRGTAMREAGRALALDPELAGAAELVGRLMLEPPRTMPRQVEAAIAADTLATHRVQARISIWILLGYLGFVPFLIGYDGSHLLAIGFTSYIVANLLVMWRSARGGHTPLVNRPAVVAVRNAILIAVIARVFSPLVLAPALAAVTTCALLITPLYTSPRAVAILVASMLAAILVPYAGELAGLLAPTSTFTPAGDGVTLHNPAVAGTAVALEVGWLIFAVGLIGVATAIAYFVRRTERDSRRRLHLHAWHLQQLVPHDGPLARR